MNTKLVNYFRRTQTGREQVLSRTADVSRSRRNLLMVIDGTRTGAQWVHQVQGATVDDLTSLLSLGLIEEVVASVSSGDTKRAAIDEALGRLTYDELYSLLTAEARERLGLLRGYRFILQIEGCSELQEMRSLAVRFLGGLRETHGSEAVARFCRTLGVL